jgi:hypothetical protein
MYQLTAVRAPVSALLSPNYQYDTRARTDGFLLPICFLMGLGGQGWWRQIVGGGGISEP